MLKSEKEDAVYMRCLINKPYLRLLGSSLFYIPERVSEYDENLFVVHNLRRDRYEVHSLANKGDTFALHFPYKGEPDARLLTIIYQNDLRHKSLKQIVYEIDRHNEELEKRNENYRRSEINAWAKETRNLFKKFAEEVY